MGQYLVLCYYTSGIFKEKNEQLESSRIQTNSLSIASQRPLTCIEKEAVKRKGSVIAYVGHDLCGLRTI